VRLADGTPEQGSAERDERADERPCRRALEDGDHEGGRIVEEDVGVKGVLEEHEAGGQEAGGEASDRTDREGNPQPMQEGHLSAQEQMIDEEERTDPAEQRDRPDGIILRREPEKQRQTIEDGQAVGERVLRGWGFG